MTPDTDNREWLGEWIYAKFVQNYEKLLEENKKLKSDLMQDMKEITELEIENKKLKSDLSECECSMHFENDEVGYRKRECKKLKEELSKYKEQYQHSLGWDDELIYEEWLYD